MIAEDKKKHLIAGALISLSSFWISPILALLLVVSIGVLKEIYDYYFGGTPDLYDAIYTIVGGLPLTIIMEIQNYL